MKNINPTNLEEAESTSEDLNAKWDKSFDKAEAVKSQTFTETMNISGKSIQEIEQYLSEKGELISAEEQEFLGTSIERKKQNNNNRTLEAQQIKGIEAEIKDMALEPENNNLDSNTPNTSGSQRAEAMRKNSESGNFKENYGLVDDIHNERNELLKLQDSWFSRAFQSNKSFIETGESRYTKMGDRVEIVKNSKGEKYIRIEEALGGGGDPGNQSIKKYYVKLEKAEPYLD